uniref:Activin_recp domain-containing protein n=1 Tax=Steinernema glaseri TaxID=37863 RepID=A0A1I7YKJ4_9BILA
MWLSFGLALLVLLGTVGYSEAVECHCTAEENCDGNGRCSGVHCVATLKAVDGTEKFVQMCASEDIEQDECAESGSNMDMNHPGKVCRCKTDLCNTLDMMTKYFLGLATEQLAKDSPQRRTPPDSINSERTWKDEIKEEISAQWAMMVSQLVILCFTLVLLLISLYFNGYLYRKFTKMYNVQQTSQSYAPSGVCPDVPNMNSGKAKPSEKMPTPAYDQVNPFPNPPHYTNQ